MSVDREAEYGCNQGLKVDHADEGEVGVDTGECAPHFVQKSPFIALLPSRPLAHQAEPNGKLCVLSIVEDGVLAEVLRLHHETGDHDELARQFVREIQLVSHDLVLLLDQPPLALHLLLLFLSHPALLLEP